MTLVLAPASACATASTSALCFASRSSTTSVVNSAKTAIETAIKARRWAGSASAIF